MKYTVEYIDFIESERRTETVGQLRLSDLRKVEKQHGVIQVVNVQIQ